MVVMFVTQDLTISVSSRVAQARFANLMRGNWLTEMSEAAYGEDVTGLLRVGPIRPVTKLVRVGVLEPVYRDGAMNVGVRWEVTGPTGGLFPVMDATLTISPAQEPASCAGMESARLVLAGSYRPPLARLGAELDSVILHRVADATVRSILCSTAAALTSSATEAATYSSDPIPRSALRTETA